MEESERVMGGGRKREPNVKSSQFTFIECEASRLQVCVVGRLESAEGRGQGLPGATYSLLLLKAQ